jgi:hypothetical protein
MVRFFGLIIRLKGKEKERRKLTKNQDTMV